MALVTVKAPGKNWPLKPADSRRINCDCGKPATHGGTFNGGAPFIYECDDCFNPGAAFARRIPIGGMRA